MKKIGVRFFVNDNNHSDFILSDILLNVVDPLWYWCCGDGENYQVEGEGYNRILNPLFRKHEMVLNGKDFIERITTTKHYVITAGIKAFLAKKDIVEILDYQDFKNSSCQLALIILDTGLVMIYLKEESLLQQFIEKANFLGCTDVKIIVEDSTKPSPQLTT